MRHLVFEQRCAPGLATARREDGRQQRDEIALMRNPGRPLGKTGILHQLGAFHRLDQSLPELGRRRQVDGDPFLVGAFERVGLRDRRPAQGPHHLALAEIVGEAVEVEVAHRLEHRDVETPALAGLAALEQRRQHAHGGILAGDGIGDRRPDDARIGRRREKPQIAARCLRHRVESGTVARRPGPAEAGDGTVDEARIAGAQLCLSRAELLGDTRTEVLDEDVGAAHEVVEDLAVVDCFDVSSAIERLFRL